MKQIISISPIKMIAESDTQKKASTFQFVHKSILEFYMSKKIFLELQDS